VTSDYDVCVMHKLTESGEHIMIIIYVDDPMIMSRHKEERV
jgi:hypothetical protein